MSIVKKFSTSANTCKVTFSYPKTKEVSSVMILGDFNDWDSAKATEMSANSKEFTAALDLKIGKSYEFRYLVNNNIWDNDISADKYVASPFSGITNSVIVLESKTKVAPKAIAKTATKAAPKAVAVKPVAKVATAKPAVTKAPVAKKVVEKPVVKASTAKAVVTKTAVAKAPVAKKVTEKSVVKAATVKPAVAKAPVAKKAVPTVKK